MSSGIQITNLLIDEVSVSSEVFKVGDTDDGDGS